MTFGAELQQPSSHRALVQLQEAEIQLLEIVRKCLYQRVKSDREYANSLSSITNLSQKLEASVNTPLFQVWVTVVKETESQIALLRDHAEKLQTYTVDRLVHLITEKRTARKFYQDERNRIDTELSKIKDEVNRLRQEYEKSVVKQVQDRAKYEELINRGVMGRKVEDAKSKLTKTSLKLHKVHNDYVAALREATSHQDNYVNTILPGLLDYQEEIQKQAVDQCKSILTNYAELTDLSTPEHAEHYGSIKTAVETLSPVKEYTAFVSEHKSKSYSQEEFVFDENLLQAYKGLLQPNKLSVDNLSIELVNHSHSEVQRLYQDGVQKLEKKKSTLGMQKEQMAAKAASGGDSINDLKRNSFSIHKRAVLDLEREIQEIQCRQAVLQDLNELYETEIQNIGDEEPPNALDLSDSNILPAAPAKNYDRSESGEPSSHLDGLRNNIHGRVNNLLSKFRKSSSTTTGPIGPPPPQPPAKDFRDEHKYIDTDIGPPRMLTKGDIDDRVNRNVADNNIPSFTDGYQQMIPNPGRRLDEEDWFHGVLPREEVQRLLMEDGDYLVREGKNKRTGEIQHVLSVFWSDHKHFIIQGGENNWRFEGEQYATIQELIVGQHNSGVPVTRKSGAILKRPIKRETWELWNDDIILGQKIGNGNFGDVFKGTYKATGMEVAIKTCRETLSDDAKKKFLQEGRILKQYEHKNIVQFIGIAAQRHPVMIVMEYVPGGALLSFLKKQGNQQTKRQLVRMCSDASAGMAYLESRNCIHRDLAARNCLVGKSNMVKISDFGMSREEEEYTVSGGLKQIPIKWTAPEALNYGIYTSACDVWSFGVLMWEVFSFGQSPYPGLTNTQARERVDEGYRMPAPDGTPQSVYDLMLKAWDQEGKNRVRFDELNRELESICRSLPVR